MVELAVDCTMHNGAACFRRLLNRACLPCREKVGGGARRGHVGKGAGGELVGAWEPGGAQGDVEETQAQGQEPKRRRLTRKVSAEEYPDVPVQVPSTFQQTHIYLPTYTTHNTH
jgi:hypothetical protein